MSEMVERVADAMRLRAIERGHPIHPVLVRHLATAAIETMREPTDAMAIEGLEKPKGMLDWQEAVCVSWRAMIDEALR